MITNKKGALLLELIISSMVLGLCAAAVGSVFILESNVMKQSIHRVNAAENLRICVDRLVAVSADTNVTFNTNHPWWGEGTVYDGPEELDPTIDPHDIMTDPSICQLPDGNVRDELNGQVSYTIIKEDLPGSHTGIDMGTGLTVTQSQGILRIVMTLTWTEPEMNNIERHETFTFFSSYFMNNDFGSWPPQPPPAS